jgi:hypothetical protein
MCFITQTMVTGWGPQSIAKQAKLPYKWLNSMVYGRYNYS